MTNERPAEPGALTDIIEDTEAAEPWRTSALAALRYRDFRLFWAGLVISNTGTWMQMFGQGYLVVQLAIRDGVPHLAPTYLGLVGLTRALPGLTFGLFGGAVADRADRRQLLLLTQVGAALVALALALLTLSGRIDITHVLLLGALSSTIFAFDAPTRQSMVPRLVGTGDIASAVGLNSVAFNGAQVVGPVLGGILYIPLGLGGLFLINSFSFLAVIAALLLMEPVPVSARRRDVTMLRSIREGLRYVRRDTVVRWLILLTFASALLARPWIQLLPAFTEHVLHVGALELSWLMGASGAGAVIGAFATASLGGLQRRGTVLLLSALAMSALIASFSLQRSMALALPILALVGFTTMLFMGLSNTMLQTRTPDHLRGRVMSVHTMVFLGFMPLGVMLLGAIGTVAGVDVAILGGSLAVGLLVSYAFVRVRALREAATMPAAGARAAARGAAGH
ncbi:MAG TPA: MFS transporter [Candidatus Limnocylindria bacterium]|nr:MFS transporter [Candidatus Limnocylindria bacterium]